MKASSIPRRPHGTLALLAALSSLSLSSARAQAPDYVFDFNTDPSDQIEIISNGVSTEWRSSGGVDDSGYLSLTDAVNGARAAVIFDDPTGGKPIEGMKFTVDCRIGGGTNDPADGFSLNIVRPNDPLLQNPRGEGYAGTRDLGASEDNLPEEGSQTGLGIGFDAWVSGGRDIIGISVRVDGALVEQVAAPTKNGEPTDVRSLQTGPRGPDGPGDISALTWQPFEAELTPSGELTVSWKGTKIIDALAVNYFPGPGQVVFGARTGGANQAHHFDNLSLTILAAVKAVVSGLTFSKEDVEFMITDGEAGALDPATISLQIDGQPVEVAVSKSGQVTTIGYTPDPPFETASIHSYVLAAKDTAGNDIRRNGTLALPVPVFPVDPLPGAEGDVGLFGTRYLWGGLNEDESLLQITSTAQAIQIIQAAANGSWTGEMFDTQHATINFTGGGLFANDDTYPDEVTTSDTWTQEDFVQYSRGYLRISEAGQYTFGVHSDDGMGLRVLGGPLFTAVEGAGQIDPGDSSTVLFAAPTGDSNTRAVLDVAAPGTYLVEFLWWERGGGDNGELYVSKGAILGGDTDPAAAWSLVGQSETVAYNIPGVDSAGWTVTGSTPDPDNALTDLASAIAALENATATENADVLNHSDPQDEGNAGNFGGNLAVPGGTDGADNNFAIKGTAKLVIPASGDYQFGFRSDDGSRLRIIGQEWNEIISSAVPDAATIEGDALIADLPTGDSSTLASITLEAGTYDIEYIGFEIGGGANFEVYGSGVGAPSNVLLRRDGAGAGVLEPALSLVAPPALRLPVVDFAREGNNVRIDFEAIDPGADHLMQSSATLETWTDLETTLTVVNGNVLSALGASLDPQMAYYRVRQLPPPAILEDDFEGDNLGWTVDAGIWERGTPTGMLTAALSGTNVYATTLTDGYPAGANSGLRSPLLDLTGVAAPRLRFFYNQIMTDDEEGGVRLDFLDENGDPLFESDIIFRGNSGGWVEFNRPFPTEARERKVFVEFRLLTDGDDSNDAFGFALDDVLVK